MRGRQTAASRAKAATLTTLKRDLRPFGTSQEGAPVVETVLAEEGRPPESVFDFVQVITAVARSKPQQDVRLVMEGKALLEGGE